jgi:hypothetical protein
MQLEPKGGMLTSKKRGPKMRYWIFDKPNK